MREREKANQIISEVDNIGSFERRNEKEFFRIEKDANEDYLVHIIDSDITQDNHKNYSHTREGLEEFLTALLNDESSLLHRL